MTLRIAGVQDLAKWTSSTTNHFFAQYNTSNDDLPCQHGAERCVDCMDGRRWLRVIGALAQKLDTATKAVRDVEFFGQLADLDFALV